MGDMSTSMKRLLLFILLFLIGGGILVALVLDVGPRNIAQAFILFGLLPFVMFVSISLLNFALYVYRWRFILNKGLPKSQCLSFWRLYLHRMSGYAFMYILPMSIFGSEPIRVGLLHEDGVPLKRATSSVVIDLAFELTAFILFVSIGLVLALFEHVALGSSGWLLILALGLFTALLVAFYVATISGRGFFRTIFRFFRLHERKGFRKLDRWLEGMEAQMTQFLNGHPKIMLWLLFLSLVMVSFKAFETWFIVYFLGTTLTFSQAFLASTIPGLAMLIPVPGGLGFYEAGNTGLFALLGIPVNAIVLVLIIRLRDIVFVAIGLFHASGSIADYVRARLFSPKLSTLDSRPSDS